MTLPPQPAPSPEDPPPMVWMPRDEWIKTQPQALLASCVLLLDEQGRILLLRYGPGQPNTGAWWLPGGMLDHGEDPWSAARRETHEETGIQLTPVPRLIGIDHRVDVLGTGPVLDCFFYAGTVADQTPIILSPEHDRYAAEPGGPPHTPALTGRGRPGG
ncbi:NUDIX hydrolase [Streptomyces sp. NPDC050485]|uniref:NUDIX hydrolase n=1 Tax=Streptomyces sp. NPDC050485 TaxID=3365617 RepID=UPI00378F40EF